MSKRCTFSPYAEQCQGITYLGKSVEKIDLIENSTEFIRKTKPICRVF